PPPRWTHSETSQSKQNSRPFTVKERKASSRQHGANWGGKRGLRDVKRTGGTGKAAMLSHGKELVDMSGEHSQTYK
ncbi:hypothetical protein, partial [Escherichia coli]|uniref:hypothetical protein n=1 Tax=Escherichia coli TaxID=562 RepID=UPI001BAE7681